MERILIVPGLRNSPPTHWQSWFEAALPGSERVIQENWERPSLETWAARVSEVIERVDDRVWIVAHSFGCLASALAGRQHPERIRGALFVAPADPARFNEPASRLSFPLDFPSHVVASSNDPWVNIDTAAYYATHWGSEFSNIGLAGHINVDSGHGPWPQGKQFFKALQQRRLKNE